jgi:hypothetical protein
MSMWRRPVDKLAGVTAPALFPPALAAYIRDTLAPAPKVAPPPRVLYPAPWKPAHKDEECPF